MLIQIILMISRRAIASIVPAGTAGEGMRRADPDALSHPGIASMTPAELADLPMGWMGAAPSDLAVQREERAACEGVQERADGRIMACPECV